jgi:hypothetical protein
MLAVVVMVCGGNATQVASAFTGSRKAQARRYVHKLGQRSRLHLSHHPPSVRLHGDLADAKIPHLLVQLTAHYQGP